MVATTYTVFELGGEELALRKISVLETAGYNGKKQKLSGVDSFILGKDHRGNVLIDLNDYLKFPLKKLTTVLYVNREGQKLGLVVNAKKEDLDIDNQYVAQTPENLANKYKTHFITGVARLDDRLIILIDEQMLFSEEDQKKIVDARSMQPKKGFLGALFGKKEGAKQEAPQETPESLSKAEQPSQTETAQPAPVQGAPPQELPQQMGSSSYTGYTPYLEIISPVRQPPPYYEAPPDPSVAQAVLSELQGHIQEIDIRESIDVDDASLEVNDSIRKLKEDVTRIPSFSTAWTAKQPAEVNEFFDHLKEDPFMKKQEEIQENIKRIKASIGQLDTFFEELLTKEESEDLPYDTSEKVLFSSVGIALDEEQKVRSDEELPQKEDDAESAQALPADKRDNDYGSQAQAEGSPPAQDATRESKGHEGLASQEASGGQDKKDAHGLMAKAAPQEQGFRFSDGRFIHTLKEFGEELRSMKDEEFAQHVSSEKNDFADWIEHAVGLKEVAERIRPATSRKQAFEVYEQFVQSTES